MTASFDSSGSMARKKAASSAPQSCRRRAWVIFAGNLQAKRNVAGMFDPAPHDGFRRGAVESGIDLNRGKIMGIEFQPTGLGQIRWIKVAPPFFKAPRASAEPDLLLIGEVQVL